MFIYLYISLIFQETITNRRMDGNGQLFQEHLQQRNSNGEKNSDAVTQQKRFLVGNRENNDNNQEMSTIEDLLATNTLHAANNHQYSRDYHHQRSSYLHNNGHHQQNHHQHHQNGCHHKNGHYHNNHNNNRSSQSNQVGKSKLVNDALNYRKVTVGSRYPDQNNYHSFSHQRQVHKDSLKENHVNSSKSPHQDCANYEDNAPNAFMQSELSDSGSAGEHHQEVIIDNALMPLSKRRIRTRSESEQLSNDENIRNGYCDSNGEFSDEQQIDDVS